MARRWSTSSRPRVRFPASSSTRARSRSPSTRARR
jgi:hypothetical protein